MPSATLAQPLDELPLRSYIRVAIANINYNKMSYTRENSALSYSYIVSDADGEIWDGLGMCFSRVESYYNPSRILAES